MASPDQFAGWALAFDTRLRTLAHELDDGWRELLKPWAFVDVLPQEQAQRLWPRLWAAHLRPVGGLPPLLCLADPWARLCLLPREALLPQLCALALAGRPGVLRCCVDRAARAPLREALGERFDALAVMSRQGRPVDAATASRSPVHWSCVGFLDWSARLPAALGGARRVVELCLPRAELAALRDAAVPPAERSPEQAAAALGEAGVVWSC